MQARESDFAEVAVDRLFLESFANEASPYHSDEAEQMIRQNLDQVREKLKWHINHSLSNRQKQVIKHYLTGKTERQIADLLGVTQQVVNIYKHRAINKLHRILTS
ncbi:MAG TPA: LuxR C-terminal-related transcriptional regulator [candidate division Zixibacteria bacterium]|nr:response regulator transcription factor [candidate division Zixibacteria bacterium]MDD4918601.1 LuxR C-terminal-related transcriptional regulator [candidate division Zixibacteria bacterium]MDM7974316.1 LuxR C-terminal-related transcriptional regulator [candidate division Zixibacteria bacterium]HPM37056.1 LuxR C-terminal-related transcriptional regulator [candidate division Zixibacteria bacterium]